MYPTIIIDFDAIRREICENAIDINEYIIDEKYIKKCFIKNLISLINIFKFKIKICYNSEIESNIDINTYFDGATDIEYINIKDTSDKIKLLVVDDYSILIDDYDKYFEYDDYDIVKNRILLLKRSWNAKSFEKFSFIMDTKENSIYIIDVENKFTMSFPKYVSSLVLKN